MRILFTFIVMFFVTALKAQTSLPINFENNTYGSTFTHNKNVHDSNTQNKWFTSSYAGLSTGYSFFKAGNARFVAAPVGFQLNRRLNNNLYAFAGATVAPVYINFNQAFLTTDLTKIKNGNSFYQSNNFGVYSAATLGLTYINNEKTFSVSGSISVERSSYPLYYNNHLNSAKPQNFIPSYR